eukprot:jgi/Ulvmu1/2510/UM138_0014.1
MNDEDAADNAANQIVALKAEVKKWRGEAERAQALAASAAEDSGSVAESKVKELAKKNRDLNLRVQRLQDELNHSRAAAQGQYDPSTMTYSMRREKAKADEEAAAEAQKYKGLYDSGVSRIGKLQQEVERLKMEKEKAAKSLKTSQSKAAALEDQLESLRAHSKSPERDADATRKRRGAAATDDDRLGLAWKTRYNDVATELQQVKQEVGEVRIVAEGALARRSVLEEQIRRAREQVKALVAKSEQDDALITTLHDRLDAGAARRGDSQLLHDHEELRRRCVQQEAQLSTQEQIILSLTAHAGKASGADSEPAPDSKAAPDTTDRRTAAPPQAPPERNPISGRGFKAEEDAAEDSKREASNGDEEEGQDATE